MNLEFLERKDFWSGVMLIAIGGGTLFIARNYQFGSSLRMGPGYFPIILGAALVMFGVYFVIQGLRTGAEKLQGSWSLRALIIVPLSLMKLGSGISLNIRKTGMRRACGGRRLAARKIPRRVRLKR